MILDHFKLDGKVALVTGAAQGLGQGYGTRVSPKPGRISPRWIVGNSD